MLATVAEFEARLGQTLAGTELSRATAALEDASAVVADFGDSDWTDETIPEAAKTVVLLVARRAFDNPEGASQKSVGDLSISYGSSRQGGSSAGAVYLTSAECRVVRRAAGHDYTSVTLAAPYGTYSGVAWLDGAL